MNFSKQTTVDQLFWLILLLGLIAHSHELEYNDQKRIHQIMEDYYYEIP